MRAADETLASRASWALLRAGLLAFLVLSPSTLAFLGIPYDLPGGSLPAKLHPGTYALSAALVLGLAARGHLIGQAIALCRRRRLVALYLAGMVYVGLWSVWRHGSSGAAFFVDTLWMPGIALLAMALHTRERQRQLLWLVLGVLVLNALIALVEYPLGRTLIPQNVGHEDLLPDDFFRSSALLGHPLNNALVVASLMPALWLLPVAAWQRGALLLLMVLAMLSFGGRSSAAAVVGLYGMAALVLAVQQVRRGGFSYVQWLLGLLAVMTMLLLLVGVVLGTGLGERIFANLTWDNSANVRLLAWRALDHLDAIDWWVGISPARTAEVADRIGLDLDYEAIENFWIALLMQVGLLGFLPFLVSLGFGVAHAWRVAPMAMRLGIVLFFVVGSGANTLASKTNSLLLLFVTAQAAATVLSPQRLRRTVVRPSFSTAPSGFARRTP